MLQCLASNSWTLDDRFALSASVFLTVAAGGVFLIIEQAGQLFTHYRLRIKTSNRPLPLLPDQRYVQSDQAAPSRIAAFARASSGIVLEIFAAPTRASDATAVSVDEPGMDGSDEDAQHSVWQRVECLAVHDYHHPLPVVQPNVPFAAASQPISSSPNGSQSTSVSSTAAPVTLRSCDGCGLVDWREEDEFVCVDGCANVRLCHWCQLNGRFNTATHSTQHHMDHKLPFPIAPSRSPERMSYLSPELCGGVVMADSDRLILIPPPLPSGSLRHWRDFTVGDVVDVRDMYQKWSANCPIIFLFVKLADAKH